MKPRIRIQTIDGPKYTKTQWANEKWAVHRTYFRHRQLAKRRCWTLTHRASGQAIVKHIDWHDARTIIGKLEAVVEQYDGLFTNGLCACDGESR